MSQPVPEEHEGPLGPTETPADEHDSELPDPEDAAPADADKPQGPLDPSGPGGIDAQPPPGSPMRSDTPAGRAGEPAEGTTQRDNAGSSLGEPSDDSGGE